MPRKNIKYTTGSDTVDAVMPFVVKFASTTINFTHHDPYGDAERAGVRELAAKIAGGELSERDLDELVRLLKGGSLLSVRDFKTAGNILTALTAFDEKFRMPGVTDSILDGAPQAAVSAETVAAAPIPENLPADVLAQAKAAGVGIPAE